MIQRGFDANVVVETNKVLSKKQIIKALEDAIVTTKRGSYEQQENYITNEEQTIIKLEEL